MELQIENIEKHFGGIRALRNISFRVRSEELIGLIGPNGAGKTTLINTISGVFKPDKGAVILDGRRIEGTPPHKIAKLGIGRTFQINRFFPKMNVRENLLLPTVATSRIDRKERGKKASEIMEFLTLDHLENEYAENLSGGQQKLLDLGRVLMLDPAIILLDEPFAGVHPQLQNKIHHYIREINAAGRAFILISHDIKSIFTLSERIIVLHNGEKIADGEPHKVRQKEEVLEAYLGV